MLVEPLLPHTPVVCVTPVLNELRHPGSGSSITLGSTDRLGRPASLRQPLTEVGELAVRNADCEREDLVGAIPCGGIRAADLHVPARTVRALLPDARLSSGCRGLSSGVVARRLARPGILPRPKLHARLALPNHHQCLPAVDLAPATADPLAGLWAPWQNTADLGNPVTGPIWLEPWQDDEPAGESSDVDPAAPYLRRGSVELAFVAALQHMPGT
jgi:hypothetical protein